MPIIIQFIVYILSINKGLNREDLRKKESRYVLRTLLDNCIRNYGVPMVCIK